MIFSEKNQVAINSESRPTLFFLTNVFPQKTISSSSRQNGANGFKFETYDFFTSWFCWKKTSGANWVLLMTEELSSKLFTKLIAKLRKEKGGREWESGGG